MTSMSKEDLVENLINTGLKVEEKSGVTINGWSPNNVRALGIGVNGAFVVFHSTPSGSRYHGLTKPVGFTEYAIKTALEEIKNGKPEHLLRSLTRGRVCSCIEEIIIADLGSAERDCLRAEIDEKDLCGGNGSIDKRLETRFPRLQHIVCTKSSLQDVYSQVKQLASKDELFVDTMKENGSFAIAGTIYERDAKAAPYWSGTALRGSIYTMDLPTGTIAKRFNKIKEGKEAVLKAEKLDEVYAKSIKMELTTSKKYVNVLTTLVQYYEMARKINDNAFTQDKLQWAHVFNSQHMQKYFNGAVVHSKGEDITLDKWGKRINFAVIEKDMAELGDCAKKATSFFEGMNIAGKTRDVEASERVQNIKDFYEMCTQALLTFQSIQWCAIVKYLLSSGDVKFAKDYAKKVRESWDKYASCDLSFSYPRCAIVFCNKYASKESYDCLKCVDDNVADFKGNSFKVASVLWKVIEDLI